MTTGSVLDEVGNDASMVFPTDIPMDIPVVLCSFGRYLVWYITQEMKDETTLFFGRNLEHLHQMYALDLVIWIIVDDFNTQYN
jgi:hypothetical protein